MRKVCRFWSRFNFHELTFLIIVITEKTNLCRTQSVKYEIQYCKRNKTKLFEKGKL